MKRLRDLVVGIDGFDKLSHADKLRLFAWVLHADGREHLKVADFAGCFDVLHTHAPASLHRAIQALEEQGDVLKSNAGYRLAKGVRDQHEARYGSRAITTQIHELLASLPAKLSSEAQKEYLDEALRCFKARAWRASVIMAWNLSFDHLCEVVIARVPEFNAAFPKAFPKLAETISTRSELRDVKESVVIRVCRVADLVDKTQAKCLERHLEIRNDAAHPSGAVFDQLKAEAFIADVVQTIVLGVKL